METKALDNVLDFLTENLDPEEFSVRTHFYILMV